MFEPDVCLEVSQFFQECIRYGSHGSTPKKYLYYIKDNPASFFPFLYLSSRRLFYHFKYRRHWINALGGLNYATLYHTRESGHIPCINCCPTPWLTAKPVGPLIRARATMSNNSRHETPKPEILCILNQANISATTHLAAQATHSLG